LLAVGWWNGDCMGAVIDLGGWANCCGCGGPARGGNGLVALRMG
jgi:hypothetical protein